MKRYIASAFLMFFTAVLLSITVSAVDSGTCGAEGDGANLTWTLDNAGTLTISGTGAMADEAFSRNDSIRRVIIQDGVTTIGEGAFSRTNLAEIIIPSSVKRIGAGAFAWLNVYWEDDSNEPLISITIPKGVKKIEEDTFYQAIFQNIAIPSSVTAIEAYAFCFSGPNDVYYEGTESQWKKISVERDDEPYYSNKPLVNATFHYNSYDNIPQNPVMSPSPVPPSNGEFFTEPVYEADTFEDYVSATSALIHKYEYILDAASDSSQYATARLIVSAKNPLPNMENYNAAQIVVDESYHYLIQFYTAKEAEYCANYLKTLPYVNYSEPDMIVSGNVERISAALEANSWGVYAIGADSYAANLRQRGVFAQVTVAVVDSGIDSDHPFLKERVLPGYDLVEDDATPQDGAWHGTHVSGTIVDCTPNLNVKILPVRVLDDDGTGYDSTVGEGIQYAANHGANVINLSLSGSGQSEYIDSCISYAISRNVTVVVAAGNNNSDTANFSPAHNKDCITVAAVDARRSKAIFSNYGEAVDIAAPGVNIKSCVPGNRYDAWDGTSMAAPHVSAAAALLLYENANLTPKQIEERLTGMAVDIGETGWNPYYGAGFLSLGNPGSMEIGPVPIAFTDVPSNAYYYQAVIWAIENGITNGTTSTTFSPDDVCTTAQILTFIWRASGSPSPNASSSTGVSSSYFSQALAWANEKGIRGAFAANAANSACTRAAAMTYMWNDAGKPVSGGNPFSDVSVNSGYASAVSWGVGRGITNGTTETTFSPNQPCTRAHIITFLYRYYVKGV